MGLNYLRNNANIAGPNSRESSPRLRRSITPPYPVSLNGSILRLTKTLINAQRGGTRY